MSRDQSPKRSKQPTLLIYFEGESWEETRHVVVDKYTAEELAMIEEWPKSDNILRDQAEYISEEDSSDDEDGTNAKCRQNRALFERLYDLPRLTGTRTFSGNVRFLFVSIFN